MAMTLSMALTASGSSGAPNLGGTDFRQFPNRPKVILFQPLRYFGIVAFLASQFDDCDNRVGVPVNYALSPDLAAGIRRVKGVRRLGVRVGNWLTAEEGKKLLDTENGDTLRSRRNRALLALLIGCGLRRAEVAALRLEDLQLREGHWVVADLRGKGGHIRTIPVPEWVKQAVDSWTLSANINANPLLRSINKAGRIWGNGFTPKVIWAVVKTKATSCGLPSVAPHDLRSYAAPRTMPNLTLVSAVVKLVPEKGSA